MLGDFLDIKSTIHDGYHMITWPITLRSLPFHGTQQKSPPRYAPFIQDVLNCTRETVSNMMV